MNKPFKIPTKLKTKKTHNPLKNIILASSVGTLLASGNSSPKTQEDLKTIGAVQGNVSQGNDVIVLGADGKDTEVATGAGDDKITGGNANDIVDAGSGNDLVNGGNGDDKINGGDGVDLLRGGNGNDEILGGKGHDYIVVIGSNSNGHYQASDINNPNGTGIDLSQLIDLDDVNNNAVSDLAQGGIIDGGEDGATLFLYGDVDLTGVTLKNITIIDLHSTLTFTAEVWNSFAQNGITTVKGDGTSKMVILDSATAIIVDFSNIDMTGIDHLIIGKNVTVIVDQSDITSLSKIDGDGILQASDASVLLDVTGKTIGSNVTVVDKLGVNSAHGPVLNFIDNINLDENIKLVGNYAATDADGDVISYALSGPQGNFFEITATGDLSFKTTPDYDAYANGDSGNHYSVFISATTGTQSVGRYLSVHLQNLDDNDPSFYKGLTPTVVLDENIIEVATFHAMDDDFTDTTISIGGTDKNLFELVKLTTGDVTSASVLNFINAPDYETDPHSYDISIIASSNGKNTSQNVTISVQDVDEFPVSFATNLPSSVNVDENTTMVGQFAANDQDLSPISYALSKPDAFYFDIDSSGLISFKSSPDFENAVPSTQTNITIEATSGGQTVTHDLAINLQDVDDLPFFLHSPEPNVNSYEGNINVWQYSASDQDDPDSQIAYSITGQNAGLFTIDSNGQLAFKIAPDYETDPHSYSVEINLTSRGQTTVLPQTINVLNYDEFAPEFSAGASSSVDVSENIVTVGQFIATDADGDDFEYFINGVDASKFNIDANGNVTFKEAPLFGSPTDDGLDNIYNITLAAIGGPNFLKGEHELVINVLNGTPSPNPPFFQGGYPSNIETQENTAFVGTYGAEDSDGDPVTIGIKTSVADDSALFDIDPNSGWLEFKNTTNFEAPTDNNQDNVYHLTIFATDGYHVIEDVLTITVRDIEELAVINGTSAANNLVGSDVIFDGGGAITSQGNDTINGFAGDDRLTGGGGVDIINGGSGVDSVIANLTTPSYHIRKAEGIIDLTYSETTSNGTYYSADSLHSIEFIEFGSTPTIIDVKSIWNELYSQEQDYFFGEADFLAWLGDDSGYNYEGL